ncbi:hypothetical protein P2318_01470 [Myxococcaceae bacterium GXIMD 01537]
MPEPHPAKILLVGLVLTILCPAILWNLRYTLPAEEVRKDTVGTPLSRHRPRSDAPQRPQGPSPEAVTFGLVATTLVGVGLTVVGLQRLRRRSKLLAEGVPVAATITRVERVLRRRRFELQLGPSFHFVRPGRSGRQDLYFNFEDHEGHFHEGHHRVGGPDLLERQYEVGDELVVVYDAHDPSRFVVDEDNERPEGVPVVGARPPARRRVRER